MMHFSFPCLAPKLVSAVVLVLFTALVGACAKPAAQTITAQDAAISPLLLFQKTPCLGLCPAYNATIYQDGRVVYVPFKNALAQDTLLMQMGRAEMDSLTKRIEKLDYHALDNTYLSGWSDISSTYTTFYQDGQAAKRIKHQEGGPEQLLQFQNWVHQLLERQVKTALSPAY
ncbi:DUF6438 domain-containing protein [Pontibacter sp. CAU 1760]